MAGLDPAIRASGRLERQDRFLAKKYVFDQSGYGENKQSNDNQ
jgi:hypothetical protein